MANLMDLLKEKLRRTLRWNEPEQPDDRDRDAAAVSKAELDGARDFSTPMQHRSGADSLLTALRQPTGTQLKQATLARARHHRSWESSPTIWGGAPTIEGGIFDRPVEVAGDTVASALSAASPKSARGTPGRPASRVAGDPQDGSAFGEPGLSAAAATSGESVTSSLGPGLDFSPPTTPERPF